jgi:integrase
VVEVDTATNRRSIHTFHDEAEAARCAAKLHREAARQNGASTAQVLALYEAHLRAKGNKPGSVATTVFRLDSLLGTMAARPIIGVTTIDLLKAVQRLGDLAGDTRLNTLAETRTFLRWALKAGHLKADMAVDLKVEARRKRGKNQLRITEARAWLTTALDLATQGDQAAAAAAMTLLMGMRASEVTDRTVRDLDDGGRLLWIPAAKTRAGVRRLQVPGVLRDILLKVASGREPGAQLFEGASRWWLRYHVVRLCQLAKVPVVGPNAMRGLHSTLAVSSGVSAEEVAKSLGHESFATNRTPLRRRRRAGRLAVCLGRGTSSEFPTSSQPGSLNPQ